MEKYFLMNEIDYQNAIEWLFVQAPNYQINGEKAYKPGLDNIKKLCSFFQNPQDKIKTIHVGGTNGKGSVSHMLASILQENGYRVGLYNSPHLVDFRERIKINGQMVSQEFVFEFIEKLKQLPSEILPSFFEYTTIMAFEYFYQSKVDFAIIEVGLGGRLDSTNIIYPLVSAITNVALDHQSILGETIEKIAFEKSGIIKNNVPIVSGDENEQVKQIIKNRSQEEKSHFIDATLVEDYFETDLKGEYQTKNQKVVLSMVEELRKQGFEISRSSVEKGLKNVQKNTSFMGRWFQFSENPLIICDTAHNQAGLELVFSQLNKIKKRKHVVLGFVQEKKIDEVLRILPENSSYYFVKPKIFRGRSPFDYENQLIKNKIKYQLFDSVEEGIARAKVDCQLDEIIFVGGSNFVVGEFLEKNL